MGQVAPVQQDVRRSAKVVIVGGGISGLSIAHALHEISARNERSTLDVLVLERGARPGGKIKSEREHGYLCEWGPNGFLDKEPATLSLCERLDLARELLPAEAAFDKRYIYRQGRLVEVSAHPLRFFMSPLLPPAGKLRLICEPLVPRRREGEHLDESVASFARRRIGAWGAEILIDAMQSGIYAGDPTRLSVNSCFPRVVEVERQYGSLVRGMLALKRRRKREGKPAGTTPGAGPTGHLTSFRRGAETLVEALASALGPRLRCEARVEAISEASGGYRVHLAGDDGDPIRADALVLACPAHVTSGLLAPFDGHLGRLLAGIEYAPLAVLCLGWRRSQVKHPLDGFGFLAPRREGLRVLGVLFSSSIFRQRAPAGHVLMRAMLGGARDAQVLELDDDHLARLALSELEPILGLAGAPEHVRVFRHQRAIPQYNIGHGARLKRIDERLAHLPNVHLAGNAYRGIGINDCVRDAATVAEQVVASLATRGVVVDAPA